jgi:predicted CxxxxCH...CXXCH cytochrome family protein
MTALLLLACATCHKAQADGHSRTLMANTLERGDSARLLAKHSPLEMVLGRYRYRVDRTDYSVTDGIATVSAPIRWAMGQGEAGQTYILEKDGKLFESRVSFYNARGGLDRTMGAPEGEPKNLLEALGRELVPKAVIECFGCHSAAGPNSKGAVRGSVAWTGTLEPGVQCANCHRGAANHAAKLTPMAKLAKLSSEEQSDLCGSCHRTWADISANGPRGVGNVRFQPYRIARSKCYDAEDRRIGCTACHDPHDRSLSGVAKYDAACKACHSSGCKTSAKSDCASCHMPKFEIPGSHHQFPDHWIRVARNKNEYPD